MLNLDTDGSIERQGLSRFYDIPKVGLSDLRNNLQFYADMFGIKECDRRLGAFAGIPRTCNLLGSGDFHHLTLLILERLTKPFALVVFDNHADCSFVYPKYHCGNWFYHAARLPMCAKAVHIGATETGGRLLGLRALQRRGSASVLPGRECAGGDGSIGRLKEILEREVPERLPVYVSIDKDVLNKDESPGDWDNGVMRMQTLGPMLECIVASRSVLGADITGEAGGRFRYRGKPLKNIFSAFEHPASTGEGFFEADTRQMVINFEILDILGVAHVAC